ncbi:DNA-binding Lrp family transcriptional regulator [Rhodococcus sp. LBL1]|nr:DNA-binding Lrp family transcriptional regulator [Rhodococcus sp. LBL1]MDH6681849.1 DNA-binding Lrp family transcriptional regulator [Rhodococcus sp. LBL2]
MNAQVGSELDIAIVDALQMNPRADWADLAQTLRHTPKTLARRWRVLSEDGSAWIALVPGPAFVRYGCAAFVTVTCQPHRKRAVAAALVAEPAIVSVSSTTGDADFLLDVFVPTLDSLTRLLDERVDRIEGIVSVTAMVALATFREGSRWRVQALDLHQSALLSKPRPVNPRRPVPPLDDLDRRLLECLVHDGRRSWSDLSECCGTTGPTARRRIERMIGSGRIALRCEGSPAVTGPVVPTTFMITAPPDQLNTVGESLASLPKCRVVEAITGRSNILLTMWLRSTSEIAAFAAALARELPGVAITDTFVALRTYKRGGFLLATDGRATDVVTPTSIFADV